MSSKRKLAGSRQSALLWTACGLAVACVWAAVVFTHDDRRQAAERAAAERAKEWRRQWAEENKLPPQDSKSIVDEAIRKLQNTGPQSPVSPRP